MKKRIISLLMTFCLLFSFMPTSSAMAESEEADITGGTRQSGGVPVYVYAETMYNGGIYKGAVEGLTLNGSGWVTLGKLISQQDLSLAVGSNNQGESYGADSGQLKAVAAELATSQFTYHDDGVKGYLNLVDQWVSLKCMNNFHDGYKGAVGDPSNDGKCVAYHLDGQINVYKVTFLYGNSAGNVVKYYPKNAAVTRPAQDPTDGSRWFVDWYGEDGQPYDFSKPITKDVTITARWTDDIPVYVYAQTVYQGTACTENVEGVTHNNNSYVTLGKMFTTQRPELVNGKTYPIDGEIARAVVDELDTAEFVPHDDSVAGYLDLVDEWTKLVCQTGSHDGYKGENPGDPNNGSVRAYHLDGVIDVCKVTFQYGNGTEDLVRYYPESNDKKTIRVVRPAAPSIDGKWFLGWYTADGKLYDFDSSVTTDLVLTAKWRDMVPGEGPDVSTVMLRVRDVNEKHAAVHGTADYYLQPTDGTGSGIQDVNGVYTYTFTVTDPADFLNRYNTGEGNGAIRGTHRLAGEPDLTITWTWGQNGWVCQNPDLGLVNGATNSEAPVAVMLDAECPFTVAFENNGTTFAAQEVYPGGTAARPDNDPANPDSGVKFAGWYKGNKKYDFSTPVTGDLTLTAHWTRRSSGGSTRYTVTVAESGRGSVSASHKSATSGTLVTVTVKPDDGYQVKAVTATVDRTGKTVKVTDKGGGKFTFAMPAGAVSVRVRFVKENPFADVPSDSYYKDAVDWAEKNDITGGVSADAFAPDRICTRAQAVTFLWRAAGSPEPETAEMPFTDVPTGSYYFKAVQWAVENGVTKGTTDTTFSPDVTCSRSHIVTFLWRAAKCPAPDSVSPFTDVPTEAYYAEAVRWAVENGITKGTTDAAFSPNQGCTRAQIVTFLYRQYSR